MRSRVEVVSVGEAVERVVKEESHYLATLQGACLASRFFEEHGWEPFFQTRWIGERLRAAGMAGQVRNPSRLVALGLLEKRHDEPRGRSPYYRVLDRGEVERVLAELGHGF